MKLKQINNIEIHLQNSVYFCLVRIVGGPSRLKEFECLADAETFCRSTPDYTWKEIHRRAKAIFSGVCIKRRKNSLWKITK